MGKRLLSFLVICLCAVSVAFAQRKVTGVVIDAETGEPVVGASVLVKGTQIGAATDLNGNFTIQNVPSSAKQLTVSYIGMNSKDVAIKSSLKIYLESSAKALNEQIVIAYGTATKESFTGSAKVVGAEQIAEVTKTNVLDALTNEVAGVQMFNPSGQPGETSPSIRIRGISSISAGNAPLIILDGAPFDGDMNEINPSDIENMTVLKDAASNALYGARGANGVIMITTKKARQGAPAKITVDAKWGANSRAQKRYETINDPALYYETYYQALKNYAVANGLSADNAHAYANTNLINGDLGLKYNIYNVPTGQDMIGVNGKLNPAATMGNVVNGYYLTADNWYDEAYRTSLRQEYNVTASQANQNSNFYTSFGYLNNEGITSNSNYERINARLKADAQLKPWLKVGMNLSYAHYKSHYMDNEDDGSSGNVFAYATSIAPIYPVYVRDANGNIMTDAYGNTMYDYGALRYAPNLERPSLAGGNALSSAVLDANTYDGDAFNGTGFAEFRFLKDFKFTTLNTVHVNNQRGKGFSNGYYGNYADNNGTITVNHGRSTAVNYQQLLNWHHEFGAHDVEVMVGHENYILTSNALSATKYNIFSEDVLELNAAIQDSQNASSASSKYNTEGWFGRVQYNYDEKYFGSASFRRDASSRFAPENRWGNFWSAGAAWLIHKESFFNAPWVDMLKLKASYGSQGNDGISSYLYTNRYGLVNADGHIAVTPSSTQKNRDISWETQGNFNAGVDFELFGSRLNGTIEFFYRKTSDMLYFFSIPASLGYTGYYDNIGDMRNRGIEVELNGDIIRTKDFVWSADLNLTHYRNKITMMPEERKTMSVYTTDLKEYKGYQSGDYFYGEGLAMWTWHMPEYAGVYSETNLPEGEEYDASKAGMSMWYRNVKDENGNVTGRTTTTTYSEADDYAIGTSLPDLYGGFGTSLKWKGVDFSINFGFQIGGKAYDSEYASLMGDPYSGHKGYAMHADMLNAWSTTNQSSDIPKFEYGYQYAASTSDRFLVSASYLSINNINIGYTLPKAWTRKAAIDNLRIYASADNVWYWSKRQGFDPRQSISGSTQASLYSPIRTISGGISITF